MEQNKLITIKKYWDITEADLAKSLLDSAGINCFLANANMVATYGLIANAMGGIELQVKESDAKKALEILNSITK